MLGCLPVGDEFTVPPIARSWRELDAAAFDRRWILPVRGGSSEGDLLLQMRSAVALTFDFEDQRGRRFRNLGDLVEAAQELERIERQAWWEGLAPQAPELFADWGATLGQLILDRRLHTDRWDPSVDHPRDGMLLFGSWDLRGQSDPWDSLDVRPLMEQGAALLLADLSSIKESENDYRIYPKNVGADYEEIFPLPGTHLVGLDEEGRPFSSLRLRFTCDLPFPFSEYTTLLHILNRYDAEGVLHTDIYSTSPDFHWLAGRDVFLPVETTEGKWVAFLLVRHFGFDLDGVPDGVEDRREALRGSLGNLKRNSERLFAARGDGVEPRNDPQVLLRVPVRGRR